MKKIILFLILFILNSSIYSQVTSVDFQMKYDTSTCLYDCYIIIQEGSATTPSQRVQFNSQYSIVTPNTSSITQIFSHMPLQSNNTYTGTIPTNWNIATAILSPECQTENNFYGIVPALNPSSSYNDLFVGDTLKLFSFETSNNIYCNDDIRLFINGVDPDSNQPGMGGNFSNGFTIGGINQRYNTNAPQVFPLTPVVTTNIDNGTIADIINESCCIDTIFFDPITNNTNITIGTEIIIQNDVVIVGNGVEETVLDGEVLNRLFHILPNASLTLMNMTLTKAYEPTNGGAIFNEGTLILENIILEDNYENTLRKPMTNVGDIIIRSNNVLIKK